METLADQAAFSFPERVVLGLLRELLTPGAFAGDGFVSTTPGIVGVVPIVEEDIARVSEPRQEANGVHREAVGYGDGFASAALLRKFDVVRRVVLTRPPALGDEAGVPCVREHVGQAFAERPLVLGVGE
ncbi:MULTISPECIES: hypothetical protein [unclassified Brevundimonas]|uniref:hypothetical protein n=1 Tax=unclassified Brevundimonas TaxID=2622653 RepID=UPI00107287A2|nr:MULTISPECIES: hypothetical protein [unclassified Brevundimonas]